MVTIKRLKKLLNKKIDKVVDYFAPTTEVHLELAKYNKETKPTRHQCGHIDRNGYVTMVNKKRICRACYQKLMKEDKHI